MLCYEYNLQLMTNHLEELLKKEMTRKDFLGFSALAVISMFSIFGVITELLSHASTPYASGESELGTLSGDATAVSDSSASGGEAVRFGGGSTSAWLTRSGSQLIGTNGSVMRFAGANIYWLGNDDNTSSFPTPAKATAALEAASAMGLTVVRSHTLGISLGSYYSVATGYDNATGQIIQNSAAIGSANDPWKPIDWAISEAGRLGLKLMIPLTDMWRFYHGGKWVFVHWLAGSNGVQDVDMAGGTTSGYGVNFSYKAGSGIDPSYTYNGVTGQTDEKTPEQQFYTNAAVVSVFKQYINIILSHKNQYTGIVNADNPVCAIWELGNELWDENQVSVASTWAESIASYIKTLAPNALVADGYMADGAYVAGTPYGGPAPGIAASHIDIVGSHYYTMPLSTSQLNADVTAAKNATTPKIFVVGEYPWSSNTTPYYQASFLSAIESNSAISGDFYWSLIASGENHGSTSLGAADVAMYYPASGSDQSAVQAFITADEAHASVMTSGKTPTPPANSMRSLSVATCTAPTSDYSFGAAGALSLSQSSAQAIGSSTSLQATVLAAGNNTYPYIFPSSAAYGAAVTAGNTYTATVAVRVGSGTVTASNVNISWYDAAGNYVSSGSPTSSNPVSNSGWTLITYAAVAPAGATQAVPQWQASFPMSTGDIIYLDEWGIFSGVSVPSWSAPA
jgi:hypothetical protein